MLVKSIQTTGVQSKIVQHIDCIWIVIVYLHDPNLVVVLTPPHSALLFKRCAQLMVQKPPRSDQIATSIPRHILVGGFNPSEKY